VEDVLEYDPVDSVPKDDVFACYKRWALSKSIPPGTELAFKRRFLAATQEHQIDVDIDRTNGGRVHIYRGIRLNEKAKKYIENIQAFSEDVF